MLCAECGSSHDVGDLALARPDALAGALAGATGRAQMGKDLCVLWGSADADEADAARAADRFFVRGSVEVRLVDALEAVVWSLWVEVDADVFERVVTRWSDFGQAGDPPQPCRVANRVPGYEDTLELEATLCFEGRERCPRVELSPSSEHAFARECRRGVTRHRCAEWFAALPPS